MPKLFIFNKLYMLPEDRKGWLCQEERRITKYQHQHRGLEFKKLFLPTTADQRFNLIGRDNHIYRGRIPAVPLDELPPEVDEASIDEEALYKEIRDMNFPPAPEQEPLGPPRRIGGKYTLSKRLTFAPIHVDSTEELEKTLVLGKDGDIYRGRGKMPSQRVLDKKLDGIRRSGQKVLKTSSTREYVEPSLVVLHTDDKQLGYGKGKKTLIKIPTTEVENVLSMMKEKSIKEESRGITSTINQKKEAERERKNLKSEASEESDERLKEIEMNDETFTEEQREAGTEVPAEEDAEESLETGTEELTGTVEALSTGEITEESETESSEETDTGESTETEESLDAGKMKETTEESDAESLGETDADESAETEESLDIGEIKETAGESETESLSEADADE